MRPLITTGLFLASLLASPISLAHFQTLIPSTAIANTSNQQQLRLDLSFTHPMNQGPAMEMATPAQFGVITREGRKDLLSSLVSYQVDGQNAYRSEYSLQGPGDHLFYVEPAPYWEPAEGVMIVHYTKVVVDAFAGDPLWQQMVGFPVEIEPLTRPYGLWQGNLFSGVVRKNGQPVPFATVEVEWLNDGRMQAPAEAFITQEIRADANGTFNFVMPFAGWWGFAALIESDITMTNPEGQSVPVEEGGLIWVHAQELPPQIHQTQTADK
ncbi:DUF4198 domain-containing protein [Aestuariirhabdus sp. Z084]|uniref:DUF4198 domain-containing protein n=1 Tax=Aestuariirhabdus haliotis TaxID=2918751 RepID=UPI00201B3A9C|nr:DUF4198 domain-containing protein [Aestuariirhabdus haliotis]MCL6416632.1 DUF4198 domain-containing protein [Aestuariirhabdus haliotis]MCL6420667.1 DUF4198 domain-containing protein [Aestuariirhabdus haliotis]